MDRQQRSSFFANNSGARSLPHLTGLVAEQKCETKSKKEHKCEKVEKYRTVSYSLNALLP